jgi:cytochrome c-type biogenesis protein CcmH
MKEPVSRRAFVRGAGVGITSVLVSSRMRAQDAPAASPTQGAANIEMPQSYYKPVSLPKKTNPRVLVTQLERDELERGLKCACPCKLDVFTCRTTDFQCGISPAMHSDVVRLIDSGYSADEIVAAFKTVYGERVLMAPVKEGFNLAGYVVPFITVGVGATMLIALLRKWKAETVATAPALVAKQVVPITGALPDATEDELRRLEAAVRGEAPR